MFFTHQTKHISDWYILRFYHFLKMFLALSLSDVVFIMLINVKIPTIVGILTFMSRINFVLSCVEHEKVFITTGPGHEIIKKLC